MSNLIDRDAFAQRVRDKAKQIIDCGQNEVDVVDMSSELMIMLENAPTVDAEPVRKWISVNDRLPEGGKDVLVIIPFKNTWIYYIAYVESGKWYVPTMYGRSNVTDITHWMPLPEPPGKDKEENDG